MISSCFSAIVPSCLGSTFAALVAVDDDETGLSLVAEEERAFQERIYTETDETAILEAGLVNELRKISVSLLQQ